MVNPSVEEWAQGQSICVTGGRGRLGKRLIARLVDLGVRQITSFDRSPPTDSGGDMQSRVRVVKDVVGDLLAPEDLDRALVGCSAVFHLGALVHVARSFDQPTEYFQVNGMGTCHLLDACKRHNVGTFIYTSTVHVYGVPQSLAIAEEHQTMPLSPYAASKLVGETIVQSYADSFGLSYVIARIANMYGYLHDSETVIGLALSQVNLGQAIELRDLTSVRDFIHVDDVVESLIRLAMARHEQPGYTVVNVSTGRASSVRQMAEALAAIAPEFGIPKPEIRQTSASLSERAPMLVIDNTRLRELTGWKPEITLEQGLRLALQELRFGDS